MRRFFFFIQARMNSLRLPGKVLMPLADGIFLVDFVYRRIRKSKFFTTERTYLLTSDNVEDDKLVEHFNRHKWNYFRGDEENVFKRFRDLAFNNRLEFKS